jgi:molybdopterin converting factor small subunit
LARLRLFAQIRETAGTTQDDIPGHDVGSVLDEACRRWGPEFEAVLARCAVWVNGEPADRHVLLEPTDEVAVLPPVSGGSGSAPHR